MAEDQQRLEAIKLLRTYVARVDALLDLLRGKGQLQGEEKDQAREMLRELKDSLKSDCSDLNKRRADLNRYESAYVLPALQQTVADIRTSVGSIPDDDWHSNIYGARIDLTHMLYQLENPNSESDEIQATD